MRTFLLIALIISVPVLYGMACGKDRIKAVFYIDHMERDERQDRMDVDRIIEVLKIQETDIIADIGAGSGLFTRKFADNATNGIVYAVDINEQLLNHIEDENKVKKISNIQTILAAEDDPNLPEKVDVIFICDTLHYIGKKPQYIQKLSSYLKHEGRIAVIDFHKNWPPMSIKFSIDDLTVWMDNAGLKLTDNYTFIQDEFYAIYKK